MSRACTQCDAKSDAKLDAKTEKFVIIETTNKESVSIKGLPCSYAYIVRVNGTPVHYSCQFEESRQALVHHISLYDSRGYSVIGNAASRSKQSIAMNLSYTLRKQ